MKDLSLHMLDIAQNSIAAGAAHLELRLEEAHGRVTLTVADDGRGMSPELLARVSDPFTTTRTTRKMGLGIPLLRLAAEQTGGGVCIESREGAGTRLRAEFDAAHIDCPPVGALGDTLSLLLQGAPELEVVFTHSARGRVFTLDTAELRALLGPQVSLAEPEVALWVRDYVEEQEQALNEITE